MDHKFPIFPILLSFFLFLFVALKIFKRSYDKPGSKRPQGPWKLPLIGNIHQLAGSLPHHGLRELAKVYGPLMSVKLGQLETMVVSSPEFAEEVLRINDAVFAFRPRILMSEIMFYNSTDITFSPIGEYWRKLRRIFSEGLLNTKRVKSLTLVREEELFNLVEEIGSSVGSVVNLTKCIYMTNYGITSRAAFSKKSEDLEEFISIVMEALELLSGFDLADLFPSFGFLDSLVFGTKAKLEKLHRRADKIYADVIKEHIEKKKNEQSGISERVSEDLIDFLLKFHEKDDLGFSLTMDNIKAVFWDMFAAGSETSATTVNWAMVQLIKNPEAMKKAQFEVRNVFSGKRSIDETRVSELKYLDCVVKEILRLHPAAPLLVPRESQEACEIKGYKIPAKTRVIVNAWAIARDPRFWTDPESFMPERFLDSSVDFKGTNFEFIPFGAGRRICPGISYGLMNVIVPLATLLYHFDWKLPDGVKHEDLDMNETFGLTTRRKRDLNLVPVSYDLSLIHKFTESKNTF